MASEFDSALHLADLTVKIDMAIIYILRLGTAGWIRYSLDSFSSTSLAVLPVLPMAFIVELTVCFHPVTPLISGICSRHHIPQNLCSCPYPPNRTPHTIKTRFSSHRSSHKFPALNSGRASARTEREPYFRSSSIYSSRGSS